MHTNLRWAKNSRRYNSTRHDDDVIGSKTTTRGASFNCRSPLSLFKYITVTYNDDLRVVNNHNSRREGGKHGGGGTHHSRAGSAFRETTHDYLLYRKEERERNTKKARRVAHLCVWPLTIQPS